MNPWEVALGFTHSQVLFAADELGVFDRLAASPSSASAVAEATGLPIRSATRLLTMLCALGLVERRPDGTYRNAAKADAQLVRGRPGYIGEMFHHLRHDLYPVWRHIGDALREERPQWHRAFPGRPSPSEGMYDDPEALRKFMEGMHAITYEVASEFAGGAPELDDVTHIVDVGGAGGSFLIAVGERFRHLRGTDFDLPPVRPIAESLFERYGVRDRMRFHEGDFWRDELPEGADAYALGFILHDWDTEGGSRLLAKIARAARPGSLLILGEYLLDDDRTGPLFVARQDLNMLVAARGQERTASEYRDWMAAYGFELDRIQRTRKGKHFMLARRRYGGGRSGARAG